MKPVATPSKTQLAMIALIATAFSLTASSLAVLSVNQNLDSTGILTTTPNLRVYSNSACTNPREAITWGTVAAGSNTSQTIYIKNTGTGTMTLSLYTSNWTPIEANTYLTIGWDREEYKLSAGQTVAATLTLTADPSITGPFTFSCTITVSGTG